MTVTLSMTPRRAEIILCAQRRDLWRSTATRKIYTSSENVTRHADLMLRAGWLRVAGDSLRTEHGRGLTPGKDVGTTLTGRALVANLPGWASHCMAYGIGPAGAAVAPFTNEQAYGRYSSLHHGRLSLNDLAAAGGTCGQADCPACPLPIGA